MQCNYHTHTPRCRHATGSERDYIEQALKNGFTELGFSDHAPYLFPDGYVSRIRMLPEELEDYVNTLLALQAEYADRIKLRVGLECEYYPKLFSRQLTFLRDYPIAYLILGQHSLRNEYDGVWTGRPTAEESDLDQYCGQTLDAMESGVFTYFAHPDLMNFTGSAAVYDRYMRRLCRRARELELPLEINLLGMQEEKQYPNPVFWRIAAEEGCTAILGSDAHEPTEVRNAACEARALAMAERLGLPVLERLEEGRFRPIRPV